MGPTDEQWAVRTRCVKENSEDVGCAILGEAQTQWLVELNTFVRCV